MVELRGGENYEEVRGDATKTNTSLLMAGAKDVASSNDRSSQTKKNPTSPERENGKAGFLLKDGKDYDAAAAFGLKTNARATPQMTSWTIV